MMAEDTGSKGKAGIEAADLARLTTEVVSAYVSGNTIPQADLPQLIDVSGGAIIPHQ